MKQKLPSADLEVVDGGHMLPITQPDVVADFIRRMTAKAPAQGVRQGRAALRLPRASDAKHPSGRPGRAAHQLRISMRHFDGRGGGGSKVTVVTPPAMLSPVWPSIETGCNEKARPVPPTRTFAPTPAPAVAWAPTPP